MVSPWPISQIPQSTPSVSHNTPFRTEMNTFLFWMVYFGIWDRCIVGFVKLIFWWCTELSQCRLTIHWKSIVVMMATLTSLAATEAVVVTTTGPRSSDIVSITTLVFKCIYMDTRANFWNRLQIYWILITVLHWAFYWDFRCQLCRHWRHRWFLWQPPVPPATTKLEYDNSLH